MKRLASSVCLVLCSVFFFSKCKKDDTPVAATTDYSPLTAGSNWTYSYSQNSSAATTFTLTATANDTTVANGKKYTILTRLTVWSILFSSTMLPVLLNQ